MSALHPFKRGDTAYLPSADGVTEHVVTQAGHARVRLRGVGWRDRVELWDDRDGAMVRHRWLADARQQGSAVHGEYRDLLRKAHAITLTLHGYIDHPAETRAGLRERLRDLLRSLDALDGSDLAAWAKTVKEPTAAEMAAAEARTEAIKAALQTKGRG